MTKTISEENGTIGMKKIKPNSKKNLDKDLKMVLLSASALMKDSMKKTESANLALVLDLKRKLELIEKEYGVSLI